MCRKESANGLSVGTIFSKHTCNERSHGPYFEIDVGKVEVGRQMPGLLRIQGSEAAGFASGSTRWWMMQFSLYSKSFCGGEKIGRIFERIDL